ncbi:hypothetical protein Tco_1321005 [Tanacetum coccineum]
MASFNQRHCFHYKDPLEEHERYQRCTFKRCWSGLSKGFCHICNEYSSIYDSNPNSFIDSPKVFNPPPQPLTHSIESLNANPNFDNTPQEQSSHYQDPSENFAQNFSQCPPQINQNFCYGCGDSLDDFFCQRCTCEFCGNGAHYGYDCPPQVPFVYNQDPCFNQNYDNFPQTSPSFQQQYICCTRCGGPHETCQCDQLVFDEPYCANCGGLHETFQCQPINQNYYEPNPCYDSSYSGFDQIEPPQFPVIHQPPQEMSIQDMEDLKQQYLDEMKTLINEKDYRSGRIDIEIKINELKENFNEMNEEIKSSVLRDLVLIPSESEGIPDNMCDVPFHDNSPPPDISKDQFKDFSDSNDDSTSIDDDSFSIDDIKRYSSEKLLNVNLLIANIEALKDNPTPSSDFMTKSSSTSLNLFLEETNTFDNSLPEFETFCFNLEEISSDSTTTRSVYLFRIMKLSIMMTIILKRRVEGSNQLLHLIFSFISFIFDLSNDPSPPADRSDFYHEEFADELDPRIRENISSTTNVNLPFEDDQSPLFSYVVWIFLPFLTYPVAPPYLLLSGNEDTIFDPDISIYHSFMPSVSHRSGTFMKFNVYPNHLNESLMEILSSTCCLMDQ